MKITIEGMEDKSVVIEGIEQFVLLCQHDDDSISSSMDCNHIFLGYAIASLKEDFVITERQSKGLVNAEN